MGDTVIKVKMLGTFSMEANGKAFSIERNSATKVNQLLQILLYNRDGISRAQLMEDLFNYEVITNPSNSLRALVFRLRKSLADCNLPDDGFVHISRGTYSWTDKIAVECDAHIFEEKADLALSLTEARAKKPVLEEACAIYRGNFLPMHVGLDWVVEISTRLKKKYFKCAKELCEIYIESKEYKKLLELSKKTVALYPYDEWQFYEMKALIELGDFREAMRLYEDTEILMHNELGLELSANMTSLLDRLGEQFSNNTGLISEVRKNLETIKEDDEGAFFCNYPVFTETFRYIKRIIKRTGQSAWLMLVTITDGKGYGLDASDRLEELSEELSGSICRSIRGGDMYTKYSENQYLILLLGITREDCNTVESRITDNMIKESRKRYLKYHLAPVNNYSKGITEEDKDIAEIIEGLE